MERLKVYSAIDSEREFQDARWGSVEQHPHEVGGWILLMEQLLADARKAWSSNAGDEKALDEIRKVIAVGVACAEQHGIKNRTFVSGGTGHPMGNPYRKDSRVKDEPRGSSSMGGRKRMTDGITDMHHKVAREVTQNLVCPFCGADARLVGGYDRVGLRNHILTGCAEFVPAKDEPRGIGD